MLIVYSCDRGYLFTGLSSSFDSGWLGLDSLQHPQGDYGLQSVVCCRSYSSLLVILVGQVLFAQLQHVPPLSIFWLRVNRLSLKIKAGFTFRVIMNSMNEGVMSFNMLYKAILYFVVIYQNLSNCEPHITRSPSWYRVLTDQ